MYEELMEQVVQPENCRKALRAVKRNGGAPGVDGMKTAELKGHLQQHWEGIRAKLLRDTYLPSPIRRVEIPKPDGGVRRLGIPTVLDRFIQQLLLQVLSPIYEPQFSESSYGFRPGRSAHEAVRAAQGFVRAGKNWMVDIDILQFFDHVHHDILMHWIGQTIRDLRVLKLIGRYLRSGVMVEGVVMPREEGTPQGGPLTPRTQKIALSLAGRCDIDDRFEYVTYSCNNMTHVKVLPGRACPENQRCVGVDRTPQDSFGSGTGVGNPAWHFQTPGLSLCATSPGGGAAGVHSRGEDGLYRQTLAPLDRKSSPVCKIHRAELERDRDAGFGRVSAEGAKAWLKREIPFESCVWNMPMIVCVRPRLPRPTNCWCQIPVGG